MSDERKGRWKHFVRADRVAAVFIVHTYDLPFMQLKVTVRESPEDGYWAIPDAFVRGQNGLADAVCGNGTTVDEAMADLLDRMSAELDRHRPSGGYRYEDFERPRPGEMGSP